MVDNEPNFDSGLVSVYLSPNRMSGIIHLIKPPYGEELVCKPNIPIGRWEPRPDAEGPTCARCIAYQQKREEAKPGA